MGDLFSFQPQIFTSHLRGFHFLYVTLPFFLFCSDLIICFSLVHGYQRSPSTPESLEKLGFSSEDCQLCRYYVCLSHLGPHKAGSYQHRPPAGTAFLLDMPVHIITYILCLSYLFCILLFGRVHSCAASRLKIESKKQKTPNF